MKNLFTIWLIIFSTGFACIAIVLDAKKYFSFSISVETTSESTEKADTDEGILQCAQLLFFSLPTETVNAYFLKLTHHFTVPEPRPPRTA